MRKVDTSIYSASKPSRIKPEVVNLGVLPPLENSRPETEKNVISPSAPLDTTLSNRDTTTPRHHDTTVAWYHDTTVELVRRAVKEFGKEAATHRFTLEEKRAIAAIVYAYKPQGIKTSENEIARIAINFLVHDYRENGEASILDKVLKALNL